MKYHSGGAGRMWLEPFFPICKVGGWGYLKSSYELRSLEMLATLGRYVSSLPFSYSKYCPLFSVRGLKGNDQTPVDVALHKESRRQNSP